MTEHFKIDKPDERNMLDDTAQGVLGTPMNRPDGPLKVTGTAMYAHEWHPEGLCHGVLVRAGKGPGNLTHLGTDEVRTMPGVIDVVTDQRLLSVPAQGMANAAPEQGHDRIAYDGQPVALVVAESFEQARFAAQSMEVVVEPDEGAHYDPWAADTKVETPKAKQSSQGDLDKAMTDAAVTVDETYTTAGHNSGAMEPHTSVAQWDGDRLTLHGSYQMLKFNKNELADSLGIKPDNVRILSPYVGGGFGSKLGICHEAVAAALASREIGRPVSVALSRQQVLEATMRRSETRQRVRLAADAEGNMSGMGHHSLVSNLGSQSFAEPVTQATPFLYKGENREIVQQVAETDRMCAGSVRAPGEAVGILAVEVAMDELAEKLGIDPVDLRLRNIPDKDPTKEIPFSSHMLGECLRSGAKSFGWDKRQKAGMRREGEWLVGMGVSSAVRVNFVIEAKARVRLDPEGTAVVETDMTDIGTGSYAIFTQIAAEMLGLPPSQVRVVLGDTDLPPGSGSGGSFGAASTGTAIWLACDNIRKTLAGKLGVESDDLTLKDGEAIAGNKRMRLSEILNSEALTAEGHVEPGKTSKEVRQATWGAHFAEVAVNAVTGEPRVRRMHGVFSAGRILNEKTARSQCLGGMTWGIGMALTEELLFDMRDGHLANRDFAEYHIPVNADVPQIEVDLLHERDAWANPMQVKGIGELGICGAGAAVANAIYNASGVRVRDFPATLDKIMAGLS
ncbi:xanthine dehydrogenase family protein molybdopterin-binding subunit [Roseicyclus sp. F158]|uniref:Xanthine dehydrogenase family protein molybdopterin-binding subunit n=1 Tax=Tropicimonas omnivorans TaxID=3075590 RepID=A0ABU3DER2_9RHOB|nr:xanthine dehydrogenase family protein molybdopterin-binding subunit [Roseicyclus sp. F158]MDT0682049.1 xanthine dehydrogenase family protein molybdopterin-binding subunit [Roseicyclus sp. F158]